MTIRGSSPLDWAILTWILVMIFWQAINDQPVGAILFFLLATAGGAIAGREWAQDAELREFKRDVRQLRRELDEFDRRAKETGLL